MASRARRRRRNCRGRWRWETVQPQDYRTRRQAAKYLGIGQHWVTWLSCELLPAWKRYYLSRRGIIRWEIVYKGFDLIRLKPRVLEIIHDQIEVEKAEEVEYLALEVCRAQRLSRSIGACDSL